MSINNRRFTVKQSKIILSLYILLYGIIIFFETMLLWNYIILCIIAALTTSYVMYAKIFFKLYDYLAKNSKPQDLNI